MGYRNDMPGHGLREEPETYSGECVGYVQRPLPLVGVPAVEAWVEWRVHAVVDGVGVVEAWRTDEAGLIDPVTLTDEEQDEARNSWCVP